jgi:hypothetical protein
MFGKIANAFAECLKDERGSDLPVTAILAAVLGTAALGAAVYVLGKVKSTTTSAGQTLDDAAAQTY